MDPFAGSGTVGSAASRLGRRFVLYDTNPDYIELMRSAVPDGPGIDLRTMMWLGCDPANPPQKCLFSSEADEAI